MRVEVERIVEYAPEDLYGGQLCPVDRQLAGSGAQARAREYIRAYEQAASKARGGAKQRPVRQVGAIRDFLYMKRAVQGGEEFAYMHLQEYRNTRKPLPSVQDIRSARTEEAQPAREQTMEEKLALFQAKFSKKRQRGSPK